MPTCFVFGLEMMSSPGRKQSGWAFFVVLQPLMFIENSMAGNDRNLDIPALLTYNLFVILCHDRGCGKEATAVFDPNKIEDLQFSTEKQIMDRKSARIKAVDLAIPIVAMANADG